MLLPPRRTVVFALPWHVRPAHGGAESLALSIAGRLAEAGARVEVWATTCDPGQESDEPRPDAFDPGESQDGALTVRRFACAPRDTRRFHRINERLLRGERLEPAEEADWLRHGVWSDTMRQAVFDRRGESLYIFAPYGVPTTVFGVGAAPHESILLPCLHREPTAALRPVIEMFSTAHHLWFNSDPERRLAESFYDMREKNHLTTAGVNHADGEPPAGGGLPAQVEKPYVLALGRMSEAKGIPTLMDHFCRFVSDSPVSLQLVLAGAGSIAPPPGCEGEIVSLGYVKEEMKWTLLRNALCYILPSERESLSLSLLEAWLCGRPALVNARGEAPPAFAIESGGGLPYAGYDEFRHALELLAREPALAAAIGARGRRFVRERFRWEDDTRRRIAFLRELEQRLEEADLAA